MCHWQIFRYNKGKSNHTTRRQFCAVQGNAVNKDQWAHKSPPGQLWSDIFICHCYPEEGNVQISGSFAAAPAARHANSSNCWKPCCGDEINSLSSLSLTARDTDLKPVFPHGDTCHCSNWLNQLSDIHGHGSSPLQLFTHPTLKMQMLTIWRPKNIVCQIPHVGEIMSKSLS